MIKSKETISILLRIFKKKVTNFNQKMVLRC